MNTPAAKRRRVDAANATLRKPFHSPLLRRQPDAGESKTPGSTSKTPEANSAKRSFEEVYSPSSPSVAKQPQAVRLPRPPGNVRHGRPASPLKGPIAPSASQATKRKIPSQIDAQAGPGDDNPFLALARAHRTAGRDAIVRELDKRLDTARQAGEIEAASERSRPGEAVDQELRDLVAKWRGAGRVAAEELFETVKERVDKLVLPFLSAYRSLSVRSCEGYIVDTVLQCGWYESVEGDAAETDGVLPGL